MLTIWCSASISSSSSVSSSLMISLFYDPKSAFSIKKNRSVEKKMIATQTFSSKSLSEQIEDVTKACFVKSSYVRASQAMRKGRGSSFKLPFPSFVGNKVRENQTKPFLSVLVSFQSGKWKYRIYINRKATRAAVSMMHKGMHRKLKETTGGCGIVIKTNIPVTRTGWEYGPGCSA